ncbi:MAG: hypothetical protein JW781_05610 [Deltaproteobacteria bacterium]|nr:hypothetical protein [Candidatus Anaeroferrophillacea bacterium]
MDWVVGFQVTGEISLGGMPVGSLTAEITMLYPPMLMTEMYDTLTLKMVNTIDGVGTFEVNGVALSAGSSASPATGDMLPAWFGNIGNGTGGLANICGLSSGTAVGNIYTGTGAGKETIRIRFGF